MKHIEPVPIPPICLIEHCFKYFKYHFCLTHEARKNELYRQLYADIGFHEEKYLIMDNGAFENGSSDVLADIIEGIETMHPQEVILPDRMFMSDKTIEMTADALRVLKPKYPGMNFQAVVQGRNYHEILDCIQAYNYMGISIIGVPKDYEAWPGGREVICSLIRGEYCPPFDVDMIHLLGMEKDVHTVRRWRNCNNIRSMDTAKPYIITAENRNMFDCKIPRQKDYFYLSDKFFDDVILLHQNENYFRHLLSVSTPPVSKLYADL